jgi:hypothetical protein
VVQKYGSTLMKEVDLIVQNPVKIIPESEKVKMEVNNKKRNNFM